MSNRKMCRHRGMASFVALAGVAALIATTRLVPVALAKKPDSHQYEIRTLSTRADTVTGGDVLIEVAVPRNVPSQKAKILVNGRDVTSSLRWQVRTLSRQSADCSNKTNGSRKHTPPAFRSLPRAPACRFLLTLRIGKAGMFVK